MAKSSPGLYPHRVSVLLVDDQAIIGQAVQRMLLEEEDIDFYYCQDPTEAIKVANQVKPTVILQDLVMPEVDGLTLVRYFRANPATREVPLIVLSSKEEADTKARAFALGANDYLVKLPDKLEIVARVRHHSKGYINLLQLNETLRELERANRFIRKTFGRYLSDDIVSSILESPDGAALGGEKRQVTILMTDLRGFTSISERLPAEDVVGMLNIYLEVMTDIILEYQGTIDEFIGDAILAVFGAPLARADDARRGVACALAMQQAMQEVNRRNQTAGYPELEMGIGINTGEVVVGNIGSRKRTKYGVVGRSVNLASRIESYTVGGQTLISETTLNACGEVLRIADQFEVSAKGVKKPILITDVTGIGGEFQIYLPQQDEVELPELSPPLAVEFSVLAGKHAGPRQYPGRIVRMLAKMACLESAIELDKLANLKLSLHDDADQELSADLYAKVIAVEGTAARLVFTSIPPEIGVFLEQSQRGQAQ